MSGGREKETKALQGDVTVVWREDSDITKSGFNVFWKKISSSFL